MHFKVFYLDSYYCGFTVCSRAKTFCVTYSVMLFDGRVVRELTVGRRIGFYKIRGEIGCGNFSHVKLGIHALTKGKTLQDTN